MAFLWSFTDSATLLSAVGVGGKEESESVPPEPGDRLEEGEFLLRLPVSSFIWKGKVTSDPEQTSSDHRDRVDPDRRAKLVQNRVPGKGGTPPSGWVSGDRAGSTVAGPFPGAWSACRHSTGRDISSPVSLAQASLCTVSSWPDSTCPCPLRAVPPRMHHVVSSPTA